MYKLDQVKEDAIYDFAVASLSILTPTIEVIWDKPDDDQRPPRPYLTLNILGGPILVGDRPVKKYKELDTWTYQFKKRITLSINIFAYENHTRIMEVLLNSLCFDSKVEILNFAGIAHWGYDGPRDMSEVRDTKWEFRSQADIFLSYGENMDDIPKEIHKVEINGKIIDIT